MEKETISCEVGKKRKHKDKSSIVSEQKSKKLQLSSKDVTSNLSNDNKVKAEKSLVNSEMKGDIAERYPVLKDENLINRFLSVPMTNNQKGRIRQVLKDNLKGTSEALLPDIIHHRIQSILKNSKDLIESDLRKLRILHNMLKTATESVNVVTKKETKDKKENKKSEKSVLNKEEPVTDVQKVEKAEKSITVKKKGPKRYVVFVGNLPLDVDKEKIMQHFREISDYIKDVRIPKTEKEKKGGIAYIELADEPSYEMALSKHHSMLGNKRIKVLYTVQKNSKISKTEAKSKAAKLVALQKTGMLVGSTPMNRRRSQRRKKMKQALLKQQEQNS